MKIANLLMTSFLMCFSLISKAQPSFEWAKQMGSSDNDQAKSVVLDASGNVYTTGIFFGTVDFNPGPDTFNLTSGGSADIFITKLDSAANFIWAVRLGGDQYDFVSSMAIDPDGYLYATGRFNGVSDFDPGIQQFNLTAMGNDGFVVKLDTAGSFEWAKQFNTSNIVEPHSIAVSNNGDVYTSGRFSGFADFDPGVNNFNMSYIGFFEDGYIVKLDPFGNFYWAVQLGANINGYAYTSSLAIDADDNVYSTGGFSDTVDFDPGPGNFIMFGDYYGDAFIWKLDKTGKFVWAKLISGNGNDDAIGIALDASANVYTTGSFNATTDFDPGAATYILSSAALGNFDGYISKLDKDGNFIWAKQQMSTVGSMYFSTFITLDNFANVYTTGIFLDTVNFDSNGAGFTLTSSGLADAFISKYDSSGNFDWVVQMGASRYTQSNCIRVDDAANIYSVGLLGLTTDFDPSVGIYNLTTSGLDDAFVLKLNANSTTPTSVEEIISNSNILLFPNPTNGKFTIQSTDDFENANISVINQIGQVLLSKNYSNSNRIELELNLPPAVYFIEIVEAGKKTVLKLVIN